MLTFWGNIEETDISAYAATLILPSYMSHLQLTPVRFAAQRPGNTGEQLLTLTYVGPGRIEQFELSPGEHALDLLCATCPGLRRDRVQLPEQGATWLWLAPVPGNNQTSDSPVVIASDITDHDGPNGGGSNESDAGMRLFFRPVCPTLAANDGEITPQIFPPEKAYLSVSRSEIFLHIDVIKAYFLAWHEWLGMREEPENMTCRATACGFLAESPYLTIEAVVSPNEIFDDLMRFAGLSRWLDELGDVTPDLDAEETAINNRGLRIVLKTARHHRTAGTVASEKPHG